MKCPHCGQEHPDNTKFCPETGRTISLPKSCRNKACKNFGKYNIQPEAQFCPECGCPVEDEKPQPHPKPNLWKWILFPVLAVVAIVAVILGVRACNRVPDEDLFPIEKPIEEERKDTSEGTDIYCNHENEECHVSMTSGMRLYFPNTIADEVVTKSGKMTISNHNNSIRIETSCDTQYETLSEAFDYWRSIAENFNMTYKRNAESFVVVSWWNGDIGNYYRAEMHNGILHEWHMIWNRKDHDVAKPILDEFKVKFEN